MEKVILVDDQDIELGLMEKMEAHEKGLLHRAFSIFLFDSDGKMLIQQRALSKYHSPGLWSNACCSHPRQGETTLDAANRRLVEELGVTANLEYQYHFIYKADVGDDLIEHELDHVFFGSFSEKPNPNADEVADWKYVDVDWLTNNVKEKPEHYTTWFRISLNEVLERLTSSSQ